MPGEITLASNGPLPFVFIKSTAREAMAASRSFGTSKIPLHFCVESRQEGRRNGRLLRVYLNEDVCFLGLRHLVESHEEERNFVFVVCENRPIKTVLTIDYPAALVSIRQYQIAECNT